MNETIQLSIVLQVALFLASVAVILLVAFIIPLAIQARKQLDQLVLRATQTNANLDVLIHDSRALIRNVDMLATRANQQMDDVNQVIGTVRQWTGRADRIVDQVGAAIEPSIFSLVRNMTMVRTGARTFLQTLFRRNHQPNTQPNNRGE